MNKRYLKYRFKIQQKFNELFGNKENIKIREVKNMKKYITQNFFTQVMLANTENVNIVDVKKIVEIDKEEITFEYTEDNKDAEKVIVDCKTRAYQGVKIENFEKMKKHRKKMINEFYAFSRKE